MREQSAEAQYASQRIDDLLQKKSQRYRTYVGDNQFIGKSIAKLRPYDLDSNRVEIGKYVGRVMLIQTLNFWCGSPEKQLPAIKHTMKIFPKMKPIFMDYGESADELKLRYFTKPASRFLKDQTVVFADSATDELLPDGRPVGLILLIDKKGIVRSVFPGNSKDLERMLQEKVRMLMNEK